MPSKDLIPAEEFCIHHKVELSFISTLHESGLIDLVISEEKLYLPVVELNQLEKLSRLYYEMDINIEGIETINHLMERMRVMQQEIKQLSNRLSMYEEEE